MSEDREEFWDRLDDIRTGMIEVEGRFVPMTLSLEPEDGKLWFLTAKGTALVAAASVGAESRFVVSDDREGIYADIKGKLGVSTSREKLDEIWTAMSSAWFEEGKSDPDIALVYLAPATAEVWLAPESSLKFFLSVAKAKITGVEPDMGRHFSLTF